MIRSSFFQSDLFMKETFYRQKELACLGGKLMEGTCLGKLDFNV